MAILFFIF